MIPRRLSRICRQHPIRVRHRPTSSDEQKMTKWVTKLMQDQPDAPITKKGARALAVEGGLQDISDRGFEDRVWPDAIKASGITEGEVVGRRAPQKRRANRRT